MTALDPLSGLGFVVTGVLSSLGRDEAKDMLMQWGGHVVGAVSSKVNYLVAGPEFGASKFAKADEKNIPILSESALKSLLEEKQSTWLAKNPVILLY